jgi:hypothetical protein
VVKVAVVQRAERRTVRVYVVAAVTLVVLNVIDVVITRAALRGGAEELNPIARFFIDHALLAYGIKFVVPAFVVVLALTPAAQRRIDEVHLAAIWTVVGIYVMTVALNTLTLSGVT